MVWFVHKQGNCIRSRWCFRGIALFKKRRIKVRRRKVSVIANKNKVRGEGEEPQMFLDKLQQMFADLLLLKVYRLT